MLKGVRIVGEERIFEHYSMMGRPPSSRRIWDATCRPAEVDRRANLVARPLDFATKRFFRR